MRHRPTDIDLLKEMNRQQINDPDLIPDGSLLAVNRPFNPLKPLTLNSQIIKWWTDSWAHHTAVKYTHPVTGQAEIIDSGPGGVLPYTMLEWVKYSYPKTWIVVPPVREVPNEEWLKYHFRPYDYRGVYWDHLVYRLTGDWKGKTGLKAAKATYCTEVWTHEMGYPDAHKMTTADVVEMFKDRITIV